MLAVLSARSTEDATVDEALVAEAARVIARTVAPGE